MIHPLVPIFRWWREDHPHDHNGHSLHPIPGQGEAHGGIGRPTAVHSPLPQVWLRHLDAAGIPRTLIFPTTTLGQLFDQTATRFAGATALVYEQSTWTYRELRQQVNRTAAGLVRLGVRRGDRVLMTLPTCPEFIFCFFACQKLGAVVINAGPLMGADDLRSVMAMTATRLVIGIDLQAHMLLRLSINSAVEHFVWVTLQSYQPVLKRIGYQFKLWHERNHDAQQPDHPPTQISFHHLLEHAGRRCPRIRVDADHTALLQPTGGTTGTLKLVQLSHKALIANAAQTAAWARAQQGQDRFLMVLPLFHVYGLSICLLGAIYAAGQMLMQTRFSPAGTLELIRRHRPTVMPIVPAMCEAICSALSSKKSTEPLVGKLHGFEDVRLCISGAAPLQRSTAERIEQLTGVQVVEGYGLTEAAPVTHVNPPGAVRFNSVGVPLSNTHCRIVSLTDGVSDVAPGEAGELLVSGPQVMSGYFSNPEQTEIALQPDTDGRLWLHTGDVMRMDEDGYFFVCDRKKDMIIRSGLKVYPLKVEKALKGHPKVADVGVVGMPDPVHSEIVTAFIVLQEGVDTHGVVNELRRHCRQHLAPYEVPSIFEFLPQLPRTGLGKLRRDLLRRQQTSSTQESSAPDSLIQAPAPNAVPQEPV